MRRILRLILLAASVFAVSCSQREQTLIVLSTNDMHAKIRSFPQLAAAVEACRDTAQMVMLVDAGDRWTGNAYVDMAPTPGMPILALMNRLGYDVATLGNHEFDLGQAYLGQMLDSIDFEVVCANVVSDTTSFPQLPPYAIIEDNGVRIGFVGVVTNYEGDEYPAGNAASFEGLRFPDPQAMAAKYGAELRPKCDVMVLISHMGDNRDAEFLATNNQYDLVIGGHTHNEIDTLIGSTLLTQTGKNINAVGVTKIRMRGRKIVGMDYQIVPLANYVADSSYMADVERYYHDPTLNKSVGEFGSMANKWGLTNWMAEAIADEADAEIGMYHVGGVRLDSICAGGVGVARIYDLEPFGTLIATMRMTPAQIRRMIVAKYNDTMNTKEAQRVDLITTTPYVLVVDAANRAIDVRFPKLHEGRSYRIALGDYIFKNYKNMEYTEGEITDDKVTEALLRELRGGEPLSLDNTPYQVVERK